MRGRIFFFALLAVLVVGVFAFSGMFGPVELPPEKATQKTADTSQRISLGITAPSVRWTGDAKPSGNGRLHLSFRVEASSPLSTLQLKIAPVTPPKTGLKVEKEMREIPTWLLGNKAIDFDGDIDLTGSLMAGQLVTVQVVAIDEDKRSGASTDIKLDLPEHRFTQPVAQALYGLRKGLQQDPARRNDALRALAVLLQQRSNFDNQDLTLLTLRSAAVRIALDESNDGLQSALDLLWHAALLFEDNPAGNVTVSQHFSPRPDGAVSKPE